MPNGILLYPEKGQALSHYYVEGEVQVTQRNPSVDWFLLVGLAILAAVSITLTLFANRPRQAHTQSDLSIQAVAEWLGVRISWDTTGSASFRQISLCRTGGTSSGQPYATLCGGYLPVAEQVEQGEQVDISAREDPHWTFAASLLDNGDFVVSNLIFIPAARQ